MKRPTYLLPEALPMTAVPRFAEGSSNELQTAQLLEGCKRLANISDVLLKGQPFLVHFQPSCLRSNMEKMSTLEPTCTMLSGKGSTPAIPSGLSPSPHSSLQCTEDEKSQELGSQQPAADNAECRTWQTRAAEHWRTAVRRAEVGGMSATGTGTSPSHPEMCLEQTFRLQVRSVGEAQEAAQAAANSTAYDTPS
ncbi:hypothetical protein Anapl_06139 [Anas platyrhynchos]|uniref:Uncharacterized protein n=1 Tax=Anas platyrhynchos TaxID=8839 RepID=R0JIP4_ANAPL|nr:hypothetical protein Anapl_06139 [Anas platyrhynchos]